jgi:hypothetical protein
MDVARDAADLKASVRGDAADVATIDPLEQTVYGAPLERLLPPPERAR